MVQAEEAEVLSKFMTDFHRRKRREVEDAGTKEVEIDSGGKKSKSSNKRRIARHLNEVYRRIFINNKGYDKDRFDEFQNRFGFTLNGIDDRARKGCEKKIWDEEIKKALEKIKTNSCGGLDFVSGKLLKYIYKVIPGLINAAVRETFNVRQRHDRLVLRTLVFIPKKTDKRNYK